MVLTQQLRKQSASGLQSSFNASYAQSFNLSVSSSFTTREGGSVAEWLACWTQAQKGLGSNRSRDAVWVTVLGKLFTPIVLCSPSSEIGSSPLKGCGGNCRPGEK